MPRSATQRASVYVATLKGIGFAGGMRRQAPDKTTSHSTKLANNANKVAGYSEGNDHSRRRLSCIPSLKAECAAMRDLIRGSLEHITGNNYSEQAA